MIIKNVLNKASDSPKKYGAAKVTNRFNIVLRSYDAKLLDQTARKVKETLNKMGIMSYGPIPLVTAVKNFVVLKSPHVNKDARQNFRLKMMKRLIQVEKSKAAIDTLNRITDIHPSVNVEIKLNEKAGAE